MRGRGGGRTQVKAGAERDPFGAAAGGAQLPGGAGTVAEIRRQKFICCDLRNSRTSVPARGSQDWEVQPRGAAAGGTGFPGSPLGPQSQRGAPSSRFGRQTV